MVYDFDGCTRLLGAIVRIWWRDALRGRDSLDDLASFLDVSPASLSSGPAPYRNKRRHHDHADLPDDDDPIPPPWRPIRRGPAYTRRGIGG